MAEARIKARVDTDASSVGRELGKATAQASQFAAKLRGIGRGIGAAFTIGAGVAIGKKLFGDADRIADAAANIGLTTDELQAFEGVARISGASVENLESGLSKLALVQADAVAGNETAIKSFQALGISAEDLNGSLGQLFQATAKGFVDTGNLGALQDVLGRGAVRLTATLKEIQKFGTLENLISQQGAAGRIIPAGEIFRGGGLVDTTIDLAERALKFSTSVVTPGASDTAAAELQREAIRQASESRRKLAEDAAKAARDEKLSELESFLGASSGSGGIGNELVRIGARGGVQQKEDEKIRVAKEQLNNLKKIEQNTSTQTTAPGVFTL